MSPGTSSSAGMRRLCPSRRTVASVRTKRASARQRLLGALLLDEADHRIDEHDTEDDRSIHPLAQPSCHDACGQEDVDERLPKL